MKYCMQLCVFAALAIQCALGNSELEPLEFDSLADDLRLNYTSNCTRPGLRCKSCTELVMCVETEFGWAEQLVESCPDRTSCFRNTCIPGENVLCDDTSAIPFQCHVPGAFPDPFDCQAYHLCVLTTEQQDNTTVEVLKGFRHTCPDDGPQKYRYDAKSTYCKYQIDDRCPSFPVPICYEVGQMGALIENDSIYYICGLIDDVLYPNLYSCPHGRRFFINRCVHGSETTSTSSPETTTPYTNTPETTTSYPTTPYTTTTPYPTTYPYTTTTPYPTTYPYTTTTPYPTTYPYTTATPYPTTYPYTTSYPYTSTYPYPTTNTDTTTPWQTTWYSKKRSSKL